MKVKTSITLSRELLTQIDRMQRFETRSAFLEAAARAYLAQLARDERDKRDVRTFARHAGELNAEAEDVLSYQAIS